MHGKSDSMKTSLESRIHLHKSLMLASFLFILCASAQARVRELPADSVALVTQMFDPDAEIPSLADLFRYSKSEVHVQRLVDCYAHIPMRRGEVLSLDVIDGVSMGCLWKLRIGGLRQKLRFKLRVPVPECATVYVNGLDLDIKVKNGFAEIDREWRNGNEVMLR